MSDLQGKLDKLNGAVRDLWDARGTKQLLEKILDIVGKVFGRETAAVLLIEPDGEHLKIEAARGYNSEVVASYRSRVGEGIAGAVAKSGKPRLVEDVSKENDYTRGVNDAVSEMAVPLVVDEKIVGVLDIESHKAPFDEDDMALLTAFAEHAALAIRHDKALGEAQERARRISILNKASRAVNAIHDPEEVIERILELAREALGFDSTAVLTPKGPKRNLVVRKALGRVGVEGLTIPPGKGVTNSVFKTGQPVLVQDITASENYVPGGMKGARSEMAAPLRLNGDIIGVLDAESTRIGAFDDLDLEVFSSFASP
jgi:sigma-B regulation protein RsbU (phosphoserine phosphatase)